MLFSQLIYPTLNIIELRSVGPEELFDRNIHDLSTHRAGSVPILATSRFRGLIEKAF